MSFFVQFWRTVLFVLSLRDYKYAWQIRSHAYEYLNDEFWQYASRRERGFLLPAQREALRILAGGYENHELVPFEEV